MTRHALRLVSVLATVVLGAVASALVLAGPASADTPADWPQADPVSGTHVVLLLVGIPVLLFVAIGLAVYLPSLARGERIAPGVTSPDDQWLGGPRKAAGELAGPDAEGSAAGGAGARW